MLKEIEIKKIKVIENHRINIESTAIHELMQSIKQHGLKQPIGVSLNGKGYTLLYGHRRLVACTKLGWNKIEAIVENPVDDEKMLMLNLTENMQRSDPSLAEYGRIICKLIDKHGLDIAQISIRLGIPRTKIDSIVNIYQLLPAKLRAKVHFRQGSKASGHQKGVSASVAQKIVGLKKSHGLNDKTVEKIFKHCEDTGTDSKDLENLSLIVDQGHDIKYATERMKEFDACSVTVIASIPELNEMMVKNKIPARTLLFKKILYGDLPPLTKPNFVNLGDIKLSEKKTDEQKKNDSYKRIDTMRCFIGSQERLGNLTKEQVAAFTELCKTITMKFSEGQIEQIKSMYKDLQNKS